VFCFAEGKRVRGVKAYVFILRRRIRPLPRGDGAAAPAQTQQRGLDPRCPEAVQEVDLAGYFARVEVRVGEFADVDLPFGVSQVGGWMDGWMMGHGFLAGAIRERERAKLTVS
jgi:hypothetical protein